MGLLDRWVPLEPKTCEACGKVKVQLYLGHKGFVLCSACDPEHKAQDYDPRRLPRGQERKDMSHREEIVIPDDAPGAAPGISFGDIIKYWGLIQSIIGAVTAGAGSFIVRLKGKRYRITVEAVA